MSKIKLFTIWSFTMYHLVYVFMLLFYFLRCINAPCGVLYKHSVYKSTKPDG